MAAPDPGLLIGEVHTGLLQHSMALPPADVERLLRIHPGQRSRMFERPIAYAVSPQVLTGVDCRLDAVHGVRVIGTVATRSLVTGGHVVQASSFARITPGAGTRRAAWGHYLARPGELETLGKPLPPQLDRAMLQPQRPPSVVDLRTISGRLLDTLQSGGLDRRPPFRAARTRLRWTARLADTAYLHFSIEDGGLRTLRLTIPRPSTLDDVWAPSVIAFCEDVAAHDWLLTCLAQAVARTNADPDRGDEVDHRLRAVVRHLLHLWMPMARPDPLGSPLWSALDRHAGFSRQWETSVNRIRDQIGIHAVRSTGGGYRRDPR